MWCFTVRKHFATRFLCSSSSVCHTIYRNFFTYYCVDVIAMEWEKENFYCIKKCEWTISKCDTIFSLPIHITSAWMWVNSWNFIFDRLFFPQVFIMFHSLFLGLFIFLTLSVLLSLSLSSSLSLDAITQVFISRFISHPHSRMQIEWWLRVV